MCWSAEASVAMVATGAVATAVTWYRGANPAIWLMLGYFAFMEALQVAGYATIDQCGTPSNRSVTWLSYLHIAFQPLFINAFAIELVPDTVKRRVRVLVYTLAATSTAVMLAQVLPLEAFGRCAPGTPLCAERLCTVSGTWHIAWDVPYNGLLVPLDAALGTRIAFPTYMLAVFVLPLVYGAWRFVLMHLFTGPVLAHLLTDSPNEMPAIWCLFSIMIILIALSPWLRGRMSARSWLGVTS